MKWVRDMVKCDGGGVAEQDASAERESRPKISALTKLHGGCYNRSPVKLAQSAQ